MVKLVTTGIGRTCNGPTVIVSGLNSVTGNSNEDIRKFPLYSTIFTYSSLLARENNRPVTIKLSLSSRGVPTFHEGVGRFTSGFNGVPCSGVGVRYGLGPTCVGLSLVSSLSLVRPCNTNGPAPIFNLCGVALGGVAPLSTGERLELALSHGGVRVATVGFFASARRFPCGVNRALSLTMGLSHGRFGKGISISMVIGSVGSSSYSARGLLSDHAGCRSFYEKGRLSHSRLSSLVPSEGSFTLLCECLGDGNNCTFRATALPRVLSGELSFNGVGIVLRTVERLELVRVSRKVGASGVSILPMGNEISLRSTPVVGGLERMF